MEMDDCANITSTCDLFFEKNIDKIALSKLLTDMKKVKIYIDSGGRVE